MENGVSRGVSEADRQPRPLARDAREAVVLAEGAIVQALDAGAQRVDSLDEAGHGHNAFGERVVLESSDDPLVRVRRAAERVARGERVGLLASAAELGPARDVMREMAAQRLAVVFHAFEPNGAEAALALADLGWALLFASDVEESLDLTLVARRAAEDSGTPFLVVHDLAHVRRVEPVLAPAAAFVEAFVGPPSTRMRGVGDPAHPSHAHVGLRAFAERVPFALASALRELDALTGRKRDMVTRSAPGRGAEASLQLVALGALGDVLLGEVPRLRALGHDVGAMKVTAFRPFPGPRAVRLLNRALAITVLEHTDEPLAQSNVLTREIKAAFSDALTWAPEYPGVGRIPRVHSGVARAAAHDVQTHDLDVVVRNMLAGEQGKRFFVLGGDAAHGLESEGSRGMGTGTSPEVFHMRGVLRSAVAAATAAELAAAVIANVLSLKVRAAIRPLTSAEGGGCAFDLVAAPERPLGAHLGSALRLIVLDDASALIQGNPVARLAVGGTLAIPSRKTAAEAVWADMPPYVKAIVFDRDARVMGWEAPEAGTDDEAIWSMAAAVTGVALGALAAPASGGPSHVDASLVERDVSEALQLFAGADAAAGARGGAVARRAFEAGVTVPRAVVLADEAAVRLGRQDARAALT